MYAYAYAYAYACLCIGWRNRFLGIDSWAPEKS
jgi:hypothetical protein